MAKHNLFLGTATKSVGDIVLMRRNGTQVARVRVRNIKNPRTAAQSLQRMLLAAVTRFYSPLSVCLEESWQGKTKSGSVSAYLKENLKRARELEFAVPKGAGWCPVPVKLSQGTMPSAEYGWNTVADAGFVLNVGTSLDDGASWGAVSAALISYYGLQDGDQVTFIWGLATGEVNTFRVDYVRKFIDVNDATEFVLPGLVIETSASGWDSHVHFGDDNDRLSGFGVIFSRYENGAWRRSTQYFAAGVAGYVGAAYQQEYLPGWMNEDVTPVSDVYLNGAPAAADTLTAYKLTAAGATTGETITTVGQYRAATLDGNQVLQVLGSDGNWYYLTTLNTRTAAYKKLCAAPGVASENGYDGPENFDYTSTVAFIDGTTIDTPNGKYGARSLAWLQGIGVDTRCAVEYGYILES